MSGSSFPPDIAEQIRTQCDQFEAAWQAGKSPVLDDYLGDMAGETRAKLVRKLTEIEQRHRRDTIGPSATTQVSLSIEPEMVTQMGLPLHARSTSESDPTDRSLPTKGADTEVTMGYLDLDSATVGSTGRLLIRCPHCACGVELLAETPFEDISCTDCGSTFKLVDREKLVSDSAAPKRIGRFKLEERLGAGGFGTVWKARDEDLDRVVAIKIPRKGQLGPDDIEQFYREARAAAQLRHPNIVPVYEVGRDGERVFIVSDLIHGDSLSQWLIGRRLDSRDVARLCITIAEALEHAHRQGIIHRDLKPSNVMIDEADQPHLMDFGLAKRELGEVTMTIDGQVLGTPTYMSPEQASGQSHWVDRRTDIYSLGVIIFKLLTDELPFRGNVQSQIQQRLTKDAPDPRSLNRHLPRDIATICLKCLERDPNKRYPTSQTLANELRRFLSGEPIHARPISRVARLGRWARRKPAQATAATLTVFLAIGGPLTAWLIEGQRQRLAELVTEKDNLIVQAAADTDRDENEIMRLNKELNLWEGRTNPWEFWPPSRSANPRHLLVKQEFFQKQYQTLAANFKNGGHDDHQLACGYFGLGMIADLLEKNEEAEKQFLAAREQLERLVLEEPDNPRYSLALAQCYQRLARLFAKERRDDAANALKQASLIYEQLASEHSDDPRFRVGWLETELHSAVMAGFESSKAHLQRAKQIESDLHAIWPSDPVELYELASFLSEQEPVLSKDP